MNTPKQAFEGNSSLECVYKDKNSEAWFPDELRAKKNFGDYTKITRASVMKKKGNGPNIRKSSKAATKPKQ